MVMDVERKDIDQKYKWDLCAIYESDEIFSQDLARCERMIKAFGFHESTMLSGAEALFEALTDFSRITVKIQKLHCYAFLSFSVDTADNEAQAKVARVRSLASFFDEVAWFVSPYLIRLSPSKVEEYMKELPKLKTFSRMIEKGLREKPHTLSDECEKLVSGLGDALCSHEQIRSIFANSDLQFDFIKDEEGKKVRLSDTNYVMYLMSPDKQVRRSAFLTLYKTYKRFANTFAAMYSSYVKEEGTLAKMRNHKSSLAASTFKDEVTPEIYNSLIKSVRSSMSVIYDYYELKREVLGVEHLHMYDLYAPLTSASERKFSYEEAVSEVLKTVSVFGKEYYDTLKSGLTERGWVDVYPSRGKRGGAFSTGCPETEPYILLNYNGTVNDVSTLAHEAGHSMHSYFSRKYNEPHNSGYTIFVAEVASTVNELLLSHRLLAEAKSKEEKLSILSELMETYKGTLFRQTMFAEFERDVHALSEKGEPLTADVLNTRYKKLVRRYFGKNVVKDKQIAYEWMRIPHFYSAFYVYKYATCISAASAIVKRIETEGDAYVGQYIEFLKCGGSRSPLESLLVAGIDMTDPTVVGAAIDDFASAIQSFRKILKDN